MISQNNNPNSGLSLAAATVRLCSICKLRQADKMFLKIATCKTCRSKLGFKPATNLLTHCINCNCLLNNMEREHGEGWCYKCNDPGRREIQ